MEWLKNYVSSMDRAGGGYKELKRLIPQMTSNNAPSGTVSASGSYETSRLVYGWKCFNDTYIDALYDIFMSTDNSSTTWAYLIYTFASPVAVAYAALKGCTQNGVSYSTKIEVQVGGNWIDISQRITVEPIKNVTAIRYGMLSSNVGYRSIWQHCDCIGYEQ